MVTISLGVRSLGSMASVMDRPSIGRNPSKCNSSAVVGAMPARVTGLATVRPAGTNGGPYQSIGTSCT